MRLIQSPRWALRRHARAATRKRPRPQFTFIGALDQVPAATVGTVAHVAAVLLRHGDRHTGVPARIRVALGSDGLSLWLEDPECSAACLEQAGDLDAVCDPRDPGLAGARVSAADGLTGLRLRWLIELDTAQSQAGSTPD